jgi:hypothetical protein
MRARARPVNGTFEAKNRKLGGLRIEVQAPVQYAQNGDEDVNARYEDADPVG